MRLVAVAIGLGMLTPGSMAMAQQPVEPAPSDQTPPGQPAPPIVGPDDAPRPITPPPDHKPGKKGDRKKGDPEPAPTDQPPIGTTVTEPATPAPDRAAPSITGPPPGLPPAPPPVTQPYAPQPSVAKPPPYIGMPPWQRPSPPLLRKRPPIGTTEDGLPLEYRGAIAFEGAAFSDGHDVMALSLAIAADIPLGKRAFVSGRLPFAFAADDGSQSPVMGNVMLGARGVLNAADNVWFGLGGKLGLPMVTEEAHQGGRRPMYVFPPVPNGMWNLHEYYPDSVPLLLAAHFTAHTDVGIVVRIELEPVWMFDFVSEDNVEFALQHAAEVQFGRDLGGGLRIQGVALPTFAEIEVEHSLVEDDLYQMSLEPFFRLERDSFYFRSGVVLPLDEKLGPPISNSWGFRLGAGVRL